jgi:hypothetical protein
MADQWKTAVKYSHGIAIPKSADRTYKAVTLENGLKVRATPCTALGSASGLPRLD